MRVKGKKANEIIDDLENDLLKRDEKRTSLNLSSPISSDKVDDISPRTGESKKNKNEKYPKKKKIVFHLPKETNKDDQGQVGTSEESTDETLPQNQENSFLEKFKNLVNENQKTTML